MRSLNISFKRWLSLFESAAVAVVDDDEDDDDTVPVPVRVTVKDSEG